MKSLPGGVAGNVKLRGKISASMNCGCCDMVNFKKSERDKEAKKEIRTWTPKKKW